MENVDNRALSFEKLFETTTMFYINLECEEEISKMINDHVVVVAKAMDSIHDKESLKRYIIDTTDALSTLTSFIGISEERFKRIISMIRKEQGYIFATEWNMSVIRSAMLDNSSIMESVVDLLWHGKYNSEMQKRIPAFYLDSLALCDILLDKKTSEGNIYHLVKRSLEGVYSNMIGDAILEEIENVINPLCKRYGLEYCKNTRVPLLDRAPSFIIGTSLHPRLIFDVSYCVTTSSTQGKKKEMARKTEEIIKRERAHGKRIFFVSFLDGAGWIGRQADFREIHRCSDFVLNIRNIHLLDNIITNYADDLRV